MEAEKSDDAEHEEHSLNTVSGSTGDFTNWSRKVSVLISHRAALLTANAWISTLGGGHFFCRHVQVAKAMAMLRHRVAGLLGDPRLGSECRVHLAYAHIQLGELRYAKRLLRAEWITVRGLPDGRIRATVLSAWDYLRRVRLLRKDLRWTADCVATCDEFYRQRFASPP